MEAPEELYQRQIICHMNAQKSEERIVLIFVTFVRFCG
jgi:hypothetical protein